MLKPIKSLVNSILEFVNTKVSHAAHLKTTDLDRLFNYKQSIEQHTAKLTFDLEEQRIKLAKTKEEISANTKDMNEHEKLYNANGNEIVARILFTLTKKDKQLRENEEILKSNVETIEKEKEQYELEHKDVSIKYSHYKKLQEISNSVVRVEGIEEYGKNRAAIENSKRETISVDTEVHELEFEQFLKNLNK